MTISLCIASLVIWIKTCSGNPWMDFTYGRSAINTFRLSASLLFYYRVFYWSNTFIQIFKTWLYFTEPLQAPSPLKPHSVILIFVLWWTNITTEWFPRCLMKLEQMHGDVLTVFSRIIKIWMTYMRIALYYYHVC